MIHVAKRVEQMRVENALFLYNRNDVTAES